MHSDSYEGLERTKPCSEKKPGDFWQRVMCFASFFYSFPARQFTGMPFWCACFFLIEYRFAMDVSSQESNMHGFTKVA
jgi:hypothetical protein